MLRTIPSSALPYARDGVLRASAVGDAVRSERMERFARKRAKDAVEQAQEECAKLHALTSAEGFAQGYGDAIGVLVPIIFDLLHQEYMIVESVLARVRASLRQSLQDLGFEVAQITRWCALQAEQSDTQMTLYLPAHRAELAEALSKHPSMAGTRVQLVDTDFPVLCAGRLVFEFDPEHLLLRDARQVIETLEYRQLLECASSEYGANIVGALRARAQRSGFASIGEGD